MSSTPAIVVFLIGITAKNSSDINSGYVGLAPILKTGRKFFLKVNTNFNLPLRSNNSITEFQYFIRAFKIHLLVLFPDYIDCVLVV